MIHCFTIASIGRMQRVSAERVRTLCRWLRSLDQRAANLPSAGKAVPSSCQWRRLVCSLSERKSSAAVEDTRRLAESWLDRIVAAQKASTGLFSLQQLRGAKVNGSEVKAGHIIERKGRVVQVLKTQHTQQGRGGATIQAEIRDVQSGLKSTERFRTTEAIERVFVEEKSFTFLYEDGGVMYLMDPTSYEQVELPKNLLGSGAAYLTDGIRVAVQQYDGKPFSATVPPKVTCTVEKAEPYFKGQTATATYKRAVLTNGATVMVPSFIVEGDEIVVDTTDNTYITRSKE